MNIKCGKYIIKSDNLNLWIEEEYTMKKGKNEGTVSTRFVTGYHTTFASLLESFAMRKLRGSEATDVETLLISFKETENDLKALIKASVDFIDELEKRELRKNI